MTEDPKPTLQIVTSVDQPVEGARGFFASASGQRLAVQAIPAGDLADRLGAAIHAISEAMSKTAPAASAFKIEKAELSLELTAKGEVRLIASGSLETKGAIKLTIVPRG